MTETADYDKGAVPTAHAASHQDGGGDELSVAGLSGELEDSQPSSWPQVSGKPTEFPPEGHAHVELDITDLDHNALKIMGVTVDDDAIGDQKVLAYDLASETIKYITPAPSGAAIESIQYGTITIPNNVTSKTATIVGVDVAKSIVLLLGLTGFDNNVQCDLARIELTNSTTVTAHKGAAGSEPTPILNFVVLEFSSGIQSVQQATISVASGANSGTATITAVVLAKSFLVYHGYTTDAYSASYYGRGFRLTLTNTTTVTATRHITAATDVVGFAVLEFS